MRTQRLAAALIAAAAVPWLARAADVQVTSSTQFVRNTDFLSKDTAQNDIQQYLRLGARFGEDNNIAVMGYGRLVGQLTTSVESRRELADNVVGRLYYLFLDYRDVVPGHLDLRAGRAFVGTSALPAIVDGAQLGGRDVLVKGLGATVFGGRRVFLDNKSELVPDRNSVWGASVSYDTVYLTRAELSYAREYREGELSRDAVSLDLGTTPLQVLSLFGRAKYDTVSSRFDELVVSVKVAPLERLVLRGEFFQSTPTFDRFTFYRFFGVEQYRQLTAGAEYQLLAWLKLVGTYALERFDANESADLYGGGIRAVPLPGLFVNASYDRRQGFAGRLGGLRLNAGYTIAKRTTLLAGVDRDDFRRDGFGDDSARKYWGGVEFALNRQLSGSARIERNENFLFNESYQGFVTLDYHP